MNKKSLHIIIPVYNEADNILPLYKSITAVADKLTDIEYKILWIDDGSKDQTFPNIKALALQDNKVEGICLSRNFGHQNALMAGIHAANADYIITMDGDMQHPPTVIPQLLQKMEQGFDIVNTKRNKQSNNPFFKHLTSRFFYRFINLISDVPIESASSDFRIFNKNVLNAICQLQEHDIFLRGLIQWIGFKVGIIEYTEEKRKYGQSKYSFTAMIRFALRAVISFSFKPLRICLYIGFVISFLSFLYGIIAIIQYTKGETVPGWTSILICILFFGGIQLLGIGLLGEYIARLFIENKKRPLYLIRETLNR